MGYLEFARKYNYSYACLDCHNPMIQNAQTAAMIAERILLRGARRAHKLLGWDSQKRQNCAALSELERSNSRSARLGGVIMVEVVLLYGGSALPALWGIAHLFPTKSVVRGFGEITPDNERIITMEWILEGVALIWIGVLVATVTAIDPGCAISRSVYILSAIGLLVFAAVSLFTGFRVKFLPFRLCPFIFTASAILILVGGVLR